MDNSPKLGVKYWIFPMVCGYLGTGSFNICLSILATFWSGEIGTGNINHKLIKATPTSRAHIKMADRQVQTCDQNGLAVSER